MNRDQLVKTVGQALVYLADRCDGAHEQDGMGYNGRDTRFGKDLAAQFEGTGKLSDAQMQAALRMLQTYKGQLNDGGIELPIEADYLAAEVVIPPSQIKLGKSGSGFVVTFPREAKDFSARLDAVRGIPGRRWDGSAKAWIVPNNSKGIVGLATVVARFDFVVAPDASALLSQADDLEVPPDKIVTIKGDHLYITFDFNPVLVEGIKSIAYTKFAEKPEPHWEAPLLDRPAVEALIDYLTRHNFHGAADVAIEALAILDQREATQAINQATSWAADIDHDLAIDGLVGQLRPFQVVGAKYGIDNERVILGDEMGLGKTIQAIAILQGSNAFPAMVACPASLKYNWEREIRKWLPSRSVSVLDTKTGDLSADVVIINYDILGKRLDDLLARNHQGIVLDESHKIKNGKSQRTKFAKKLGKGVRVRLCLTGTAIKNRPKELIPQLEFLDRLDDIGGFWRFATTYCAAQKTRYGWDLDGASNLDELNGKLRGICYVRRIKRDVLPELPAVQQSTIEIEIDNRKEYRQALLNMAQWIRDNTPAANATEAIRKAFQAEQLVQIGILKRVAAKGKMASIISWVEDFLESGEKLVLFAIHREIVEGLADHFNAPRIDGSIPAADRQRIVDQFQHDPATNLIVLNVQAGGEGLTLTAASNVAFAELPWTPADVDQATARVDRIGQEAESVNAWYLLGKDTIDQDIADLLEAKRRVTDAVNVGSKADKEMSMVEAVMTRILSPVK